MIVLELTEIELTLLDRVLEDMVIEAETEARSNKNTLYTEFLHGCEGIAADIRGKIKAARPE